MILDDAQRLPRQVLDAFFGRYGRPLDAAAVQGGFDPVVTLSDGTTRIGCFSYRAPVDVIANDYIVYLRDGAEPVAIAAPTFAALIARFSRT